MRLFRQHELQNSVALLANRAALRDRLEEDGYLFFRNLIPESVIDRAKRDISAILVQHGYVDRFDESTPRWSGKRELVEGAIHDLQASGAVGRSIGALESVRAVYTCPDVLRVFRMIFGREVYCWVSSADRVKVKLPGHDTYAHQDTAYYALSARGRSIPFLVAWLPFMNVGEMEGGLVLEPGSHQDHLQVFAVPDHEASLPNSWCRFQVLGMPSNRDELQQWRAAGAFVLHGDTLSFNDDRIWFGADYQVGDVLVFHRRTVHKALPNVSRAVRISADFRYQAVGTQLDFRACNRQLTIDRFSAAVREHAARYTDNHMQVDRIISLMLVEGPEDGDWSRIPAQIERLLAGLECDDPELCLPARLEPMA